MSSLAAPSFEMAVARVELASLPRGAASLAPLGFASLALGVRSASRLRRSLLVAAKATGRRRSSVALSGDSTRSPSVA